MGLKIYKPRVIMARVWYTYLQIKMIFERHSITEGLFQAQQFKGQF